MVIKALLVLVFMGIGFAIGLASGIPVTQNSTQNTAHDLHPYFYYLLTIFITNFMSDVKIMLGGFAMGLPSALWLVSLGSGLGRVLSPVTIRGVYAYHDVSPIHYVLIILSYGIFEYLGYAVSGFVGFSISESVIRLIRRGKFWVDKYVIYLALLAVALTFIGAVIEAYLIISMVPR